MEKPRPKVLLTLDVEDWFDANFPALDTPRLSVRMRALRESTSYRMDAAVDRWISLLQERGATSTCFVLGSFARAYPNCIKRLCEAGHELASHGDTHDLVYKMTQEDFRLFLRRGMESLAAITGAAPKGFRAPSWSVSTSRTPWLAEELLAAGFVYDSSIFPIRTPLFGDRSSAVLPFFEGPLLRIPAGVLELTRQVRVPFSSGAFFRLWPQLALRWGMSRTLRQGRIPMIVLHPRELDPNHVRIPLGGWEGFVHYVNLSTVSSKLRALLERFEGTSVQNELRHLSDGAKSSGMTSL